ncbi:WD repeat-containing protein 74 [Condylostylus longicornis]|uniref:WD repeat-containing protein 74 n=1 Tax=Condylostylus longicornis TaxID=2530218 RepID=UPI00244DF6BD|nr:WD repeat-containing protein 74 [Condylostylus longicornis]
MRIDTLNYKNEDYLENHEIFVGTHIGCLKRICVAEEDPFSQQNLQDLKTLTQGSRISALSFGDDISNEVLIGRENKMVQTYLTNEKRFESVEEFSEGPIVGLGKFNDSIIAGIGTGKIQQHLDTESITIVTGDNTSRLRQCPINKNLFASGGKERQNNLKVFDMNESKEIFKSKNLPNDYLQLEVPIWDSDLGFIDGNLVATCSRYGYVRVYDIRKQRRPILKYATPEEQTSFCSLIARDNYVYCGTTMGMAKAFDIRKFKNFVHTYKGFTGSVSDLYLDESGKYLVSSCLDRYVRVHNSDTCVMLYQCYVKSKATRILVKTIGNIEKNELEEKDNEGKSMNGNNVEDVEHCSDEEYDAMFANMPKVDESEKNEKSSKRKAIQNGKKIKKKKL